MSATTVGRWWHHSGMEYVGRKRMTDLELGRPLPSHPYAVPPSPGSMGVWLIRRPGRHPLGYVVIRPERPEELSSRPVYQCYAHCRDASNKRPWLKTADTLNSAVAWMVQHEREIQRLIVSCDPEPEAWPPDAT